MDVIEGQDVPTTDAVSAPDLNAPEITNLDSLSQWQYQGKTFTPDEWASIHSEHSEWKEKIGEYEKTQKYLDNFETDLENVLNDPRLAERFKQVYPKPFHVALDRLLSKPTPQPTVQSGNAQSLSLPKEFLSEFNQIKAQLQGITQESQKVKEEAAAAHLDATLPKLLTKYPMASEVEVLTRAEALLSQKQKVTDAVFERLARESHEAYTKKADQYHGAKLKEQLAKGERAKDTGSGGGSPGMKPNRPRTFDEAREAMLKHVGA